jgi:hypothetical protein
VSASGKLSALAGQSKGSRAIRFCWDKEREEITTFTRGEFERLYGKKPKVHIKYLDGIEPLEIITLPALIQYLERSNPGSKLSFESIQDCSGGAVLTLAIEDSDNTSAEQMEQLRSSIQAEAEQKPSQFRRVLREKEEIILWLDGQVESLNWTFNELLLNQKPTILLTAGDFKMGDEYNVRGQAGAVGPNAHAHDMTFNQIVSQIDKSTDFGQLANELVKLRRRMIQEAKETSQYIAVGEVAKAEEKARNKDSSKAVKSLKAAGKWTLEVATKIGVSLTTDVINSLWG